MQRYLILITCLLFAEIGFSQTVLTYQSADSITYSQFISRDYKALHRTGKEALRNEIDFFLLRMRMGISYYEKKNYEAALPHFKKANNMNPADILAKEYLYYSLLFTNRTEDAYDLAKTFSEELKSKIQWKPCSAKDLASTFQSASMSVSNGYNTNIQDNKDVEYPDSVYVENTMQGQTWGGNISLHNKPSNRLNIYNNFTLYTINSLGRIHTAINDTTKEYNNTVYQYNLGINYKFKNQFLVGATFGYYKERSNYLSASLDTSTFTAYYRDYPFEHTAYSSTLYSSYRWKLFDFGLSASVSNFSDSMQYQSTATAAYFPLGNQLLYLSASASFLQNGSVQNFIYSGKIGGRITKWLWLEAHGTYGNQQNYLGANGFLAYNTVEPILYNAGANLTLNFGKLSIIPSYTLQQKESTFFQRTLSQLAYMNNTYFNHLISTSIKWNF